MSSSSPQPTSDPEKQRDRVVTWRVALVGLAGVVVAGLIGGGSAYLTAHVQSHSQASEDRSNFIRQERQAAYASLKTYSDAYRTDLEAYRNSMDAAGQSGKPLPATPANLQTDYLTLSKDEGNIGLLGSANVRGTAVHVDSAIEDFARKNGPTLNNSLRGVTGT